MRVLITGGAGFIGSHIAEYFQGKAEVRVQSILRKFYIIIMVLILMPMLQAEVIS